MRGEGERSAEMEGYQGITDVEAGRADGGGSVSGWGRGSGPKGSGTSIFGVFVGRGGDLFSFVVTGLGA